MRGSYRRNVPNPHPRRIITAVVVLVVLALLVRELVLGAVAVTNNSVYRLSGWLFDSSNSIPAYFRDRAMLINRITELESEVARSSGNALTIRNLVKENRHLRSLVGDATTTHQLANIIGRPPQLAYDSLLIDVGQRAGIEPGAIVYAHENRAIGVVLDVFPESALVGLVTAPGTRSSVFVLGPNLFASAIGRGGGVLEVQVPQGVLVSSGDLVVVPAIGGGIYGSVASVDSVATQPVQSAFVTIDVPIQNLRAVTVSTEPVSELSFREAEAIVREALTPALTFPLPEGDAASSTLQFATSSPATTAATTAPMSQ